MEKKSEYRIAAFIRDSITATPIGEDTQKTFESALLGKSNPCRADYGCVFLFGKESRYYGKKASSIIINVARQIAQNNSISYSNSSTLLIISTTKGDIGDLDGSGYILNTMAETVGRALGCTNRPIIISNACISGVSAIIIAKCYIQRGLYRNIVVAGCDTVTSFVYTGFDSFKSLSKEPCKPYDLHRNGLNLGEAGAALLLSTEGFVEVKGGAITNDANHISGPSRTGDGLYYAIEEAMTEAYGSVTHPVDFINAHGTATLYNDEMESKAIALASMAAPDGIPVNSLKGYIGHTLGASGVVETALCAEQLRRGIILGTKGFTELGVPAPINVSAQHIMMKEPYEGVRCCIKTASGFGGCNAALVLELANSNENTTALPQQTDCAEKAMSMHLSEQNIDKEKFGFKQCSIYKGKIEAGGEAVMESGEEFAQFIREAYKKFCEPNMKFYKMDDLCKLGYVAAEILLKDEPPADPRETAIVLANDVASADSDLKHINILDESGVASPAVFVYTLANIVLGEICIRHKIKGENTFFITGEQDFARVEDYALSLFEHKQYKRVIYGWCSYLNKGYNAIFNLIKKTV